MKYDIDEEFIFSTIKEHWESFARATHAKNWVIGISGGKDSTVVAALATKIFGKEHVFGVLMPCDGQKDIDDSHRVVEILGIKSFTIDIGDAFHSIISSIENNAVDVSYDTKTNLPARLRMSTLYAVAQSVNGMVLNTCNLSEDYVGYATLFGDSAGSYAPIKNLTVTEVRRLGKYLGLPDDLVMKTPVDGLQELSDEQKLGMTYEEIDSVIRGFSDNKELEDRVYDMYQKNKFKTQIIQIPGPLF